ncbi:MAG: nicotinate-nucleotide--dimethylbenzimidazole phosphoribosyltransferase [Acidimicrobiales bacterium]
MAGHLPFDAVAFTPGALLAADAAPDTPDPTRPGARRLVGALAKLDVQMAVIVDPSHESLGSTMDRLEDAGLGAVMVIPTTGQESRPVTARRPLPLAAPERTLVVAAEADPPPDASIAPRFAGIVILRTEHLLTHAVLAYVARAAGPATAAALMVPPLDDVAMEAAAERHLSLTKPPGSLGRLEDLGIQLSGISGQVPPPSPRPAAVAIFAADHGVHAQGVSPWPQEVTTQMVVNFLSGGAAINVIARLSKAKVVVVDVGVVGDLPPAANLIDRKVARGTRDLVLGAAMTTEEAVQALDAGAETAIELVASGARCLLTGDMGIANTTASAALIGALTGRRAGDITGPGSGLPDDEIPRKATIIAEAVARARAYHRDDPLGVLTEVGGFEHAALAGFVLAGAATGVPVIVDGVIAAAGLLVAAHLVPGVESLTIAGHRSQEPGSRAVLDTLGLEPVVDLDLRLGEGTGAALALPLVEAAARVLTEMATFDQAGVSAKNDLGSGL